MAAIKGKDTKPELIIRSGLHRLGYRFRVNRKDLPGRPDLVFRKYDAVVFVHGCFWHGHDCQLFRLPQTRPEFWADKISGNRKRDAAAGSALASEGWRVAVIWECALKGKGRLEQQELFARVTGWLDGPDSELDIRGQPASGTATSSVEAPEAPQPDASCA